MDVLKVNPYSALQKNSSYYINVQQTVQVIDYFITIIIIIYFFYIYNSGISYRK